MTDYDWDFAIGDLGDPLADIEWWMTPPCLKRTTQLNKENTDDQADDQESN